MKRWALGLFASLLLFLALAVLVGGFHYRKFVRYSPAGEAEFKSDLAFVPDIGATLFGSDQKTIIPFVIYYRGERDGDGHVTIQTEHENDPRYGYDALSYLEFTDLTVGSAGKKKSLITKDAPLRVYLNTERWASRSKKLGACEGEEVEIEATGIAHTKDGEMHEFWHRRKWRKSRSRRWEIGLGGGP